MNKFNVQSLRIAAVSAAAALAMNANAALSTDVTTAITTAQTDLVALLTALTAAGTVVFVARAIYRYFKLR